MNPQYNLVRASTVAIEEAGPSCQGPKYNVIWPSEIFPVGRRKDT